MLLAGKEGSHYRNMMIGKVLPSGVDGGVIARAAVKAYEPIMYPYPSEIDVAEARYSLLTETTARKKALAKEAPTKSVGIPIIEPTSGKAVTDERGFIVFSNHTEKRSPNMSIVEASVKHTLFEAAAQVRAQSPNKYVDTHYTDVGGDISDDNSDALFRERLERIRILQKNGVHK